jgi:hypothetical protein
MAATESSATTALGSWERNSACGVGLGMDGNTDRIQDGRALGRAKLAEGLLLGSAALLPLVLAAGAAWIVSPRVAAAIIVAAAGWSGALLAFLAGVRRGLTFSEAGGPEAREIASMLWVFALGVATLLLRYTPAALGLAMVGFASVAVLDRRAARRLQAPPYFAVFRPIQMVVTLAALAALLAKVMVG